MTTKLTNGTLLVNGEMTDIFEVKIGEVRNDMIINITLVPNAYTAENGVEEIETSFDPLNETLIDLLKSEGYTVVTAKQVEMIQY